MAPLLDRALSCSSVDRPEESPANTLRPSACATRIGAATRRLPGMAAGGQLFHIRHQVACGCCDGRPCYWSSTGNPSAASPEWIAFAPTASRAGATAALVGAFSVMPYQAYWHPGAPVYAPRFAELALLAPAASPAAFEQSIAGAPPHDQRLGARCYYRSPRFAVAQTMTLQRFVLPRPALFVGGVIVVRLVGKAQRQTIDAPPAALLGVDDDARADHYYCCLAHVACEGAPLELHATFDGGDGATDAEEATPPPRLARPAKSVNRPKWTW